MRLSLRSLSARPSWLPGSGGALIALTLLLAGSSLPSPAAETVDPLAYVPANAGFFTHARVAEIWNSPLGKEIRKAAGKDLDDALAEAQKAVGVSLDSVETITFCYPTLPMGNGDQLTFVVIVTTNKPFDKNAILKEVRDAKKGKEEDGFTQLQEKLLLHFPNERTFVVLHESNRAAFKKGPLGEQKPGAMTEALKLANDKHHLVYSLDFSQLPNELFTAAPAELRPFLPLLKTKSNALFADLKDKEIKINVNFAGENAAAAQDAERSFKLLMKLASVGLSSLYKDEDFVKKEIGALLPGLKEIERALNDVKVNRDGTHLETAIVLKTDHQIGELVKETIKKLNGGASQAKGSNNMKQIALAMHNFHDSYNGFPAAAICNKKGKPLLSWRVAILPYVEQSDLYKEFKLDEAWDSDHNKKLIAKMPNIYAQPGVKGDDGKTHYRVFTGNGAVFDLVQQTKIQDIADGTSNTIMVVETAETTIWTKPDDIEYDDKLPIEKLLLYKEGRTTVSFCDGSVRSIKKGIADKTWHLLIQRSDGQVIPNYDE